jgi:hypothetical protein
MNTKQLIESLIKDLHENKSLVDVFLKIQTIAYLLKHEQLAEWFNNENNGYKDDIELPEYRVLHVSYYAQIAEERGCAGFLVHNRYELPIDLIEDWGVQKKIELREPISRIYDLVANKTRGVMSLPIPNADHAISLLQRQIRSDCLIRNIWREVQKDGVQNIISQVKSKLLQFLLEINENLNLDISFTEMENKDKITKAFTQNITNNIFGNSNNVATGEIVEQNINQSFVDYEKLKGYGVEEQHIEELKGIEKEPDKNILKEKVFSWLGKVSTAIAARGLYDNIPAIMGCVKGLIN